MHHVLVAIYLCLATLLASDAVAQVAPSATEVSTYNDLQLAAHNNDAAAIEKLIADGADPNQRDSRGRTPAHIAGHASALEALAVLVDAGTDINAFENDRYDVITIAAVADDLETMNLAIEHGGDPTLVTSVYDGTALIAAAHLGHHEIVSALIAAGAPLDHINNLGWTALIEAVILGNGGERHIKTVKALVDAGADKSIADRNGITPLQHATNSGYSEIVALLK